LMVTSMTCSATCLLRTASLMSFSLAFSLLRSGLAEAG
jgi:hypothetical protein